MKIWLLQPSTFSPPHICRADLKPFPDTIFGFVIVANDEDEARKEAAERAKNNRWLDPKQVVCLEITRKLLNKVREPFIVLTEYQNKE